MPPDNDLLIGELKGKMDLMLAKQDNFDNKLDLHNQRLNTVETKAATSAFAVSLIITTGFDLIKAKLGI